MMKKQKIGFLGAGNMIQAIISGLKQYENEFEISISSPNSAEKIASEFSVKYQNQNKLVEENDVIFLGFLPDQLEEIIEEITPEKFTNKTVISILGSTSLENLNKILPNSTNIRVLPNLNVSILQGDTGIAKSPNNETANKIFKKLGNIYEVSESQLPILSAVLGSAPAFIAKIVEDLTNVAIANGMDSQIAEIATTHMTQATLEVINKEQITPNDFIRRVASPGGSTQRGLNSISNQIEIVLNAAIKKTIGLK